MLDHVSFGVHDLEPQDLDGHAVEVLTRAAD